MRKAAERCGSVLDSAFPGADRFLQLLKVRKATALSGMGEVDETHFLRSQKGARKVAGRKARSAEEKRQNPDSGRARRGAGRWRPNRGDLYAMLGKAKRLPGPGRGVAKAPC